VFIVRVFLSVAIVLPHPPCTSTHKMPTTEPNQSMLQKFPDWPPGARTANGTALCHYMQLYRYFVSQHSEFCRHNPLCCFSTNVYCCKRTFLYRFSPETFGYTLVCSKYLGQKQVYTWLNIEFSKYVCDLKLQNETFN
jgi:hypothetical protein